jgi:hypothetical protein
MYIEVSKSALENTKIGKEERKEECNLKVHVNLLLIFTNIFNYWQQSLLA